MAQTSHRFARAGLALAGVVAVISALGTTAGAEPAAASRVVSYHGYQVSVPAAWPVVDLATEKACVRFDRPVVYLGTPRHQETCPADLTGRDAGLLIEPLNGQAATRPGVVPAEAGTAVAPAAPSASGTLQIAVESAGVLVTAAHGPGNEEAVRGILGTGKVVAGGRATTLDAESKASRVVQPTAAVVAPGTYNGKGFDQCAAPSQSAMDTWWNASPYKAVGIYISGIQRACAQPNLTATWIANQHNRGWKFLPLHVGLQAPCRGTGHMMSSNPATARAQGHEAAVESVAAAQALGLVAGSVLYNDMEAYPRGGACTTAVMSFLAGWTDELHARGYLSGVYSSAASGIADLVANYNSTTYQRPDHVFFAWWNNVANTDGGQYIPASYWADHQRIKQYAGDVRETWGGVTIAIDRDFFDTANGGPPPPCAAVSLDASAYPDLRAGSTGNLVKAAQCLLQTAGSMPAGEPSGTFDAATEAAVESFQTSVSLPATGGVDSRTWTALLSYGSTPTLRSGASGPDVSRLQRALTAALGRTVGIDGSFGPITEQAVEDYQTARKLGVDGIVGAETWKALQSGA
ncbi:glycoside hydrolase domain-containing protein [Microlunatus parietis]|uniref:Peptidoglycan hydrolase-like protein with peptidoglycan-binding domain n=1 Tax=Microlunatus parietis TaxID=682979 RepID=A0A7Y9LCF8_9ACTN|nr:glycoside hydrolase domain-containing protein [Microlunatus parietis]NYE70861.1 peptidoglycan hydrolase-like protein with peptidoglycan-binding domain [Microlunatus parietis]